MAKDRTNLNPESVSVKKMASRQVSMKLPRSDDGKVHPAAGMRDNTSAAHYADAMDRATTGTGSKLDLASGN
jgi:hypothetical protein